MDRLKQSTTVQAVAIVLGVAAAGCGNVRPDAEPAIEFVTVPAAGPGGSDRLAAIAGRVSGARPGDQIVLYAKVASGGCSPIPRQPFTTIATDGAWKNTTHLGAEYAALLVDAGYRPPVDRRRPAAGRRRGSGGGDGEGDGRPRRPTAEHDQLQRLRVGSPRLAERSRRSERLRSGERLDRCRRVPASQAGAAQRSLDQRRSDADAHRSATAPMPSSSATLRTSSLRPRSVSSPGTMRAATRIIASSTSRSAAGAIPRSPTRSTSYSRTTSPPTSVDSPRRAGVSPTRFAGSRGARRSGPFAAPSAAPSSPAVAEHEFTSGVPVPGNERVRMNLYFFRFSPTSLQKEAEVVIEKFQYLP